MQTKAKREVDRECPGANLTLFRCSPEPTGLCLATSSTFLTRRAGATRSYTRRNGAGPLGENGGKRSTRGGCETVYGHDPPARGAAKTGTRIGIPTLLCFVLENLIMQLNMKVERAPPQVFTPHLLIFQHGFPVFWG